MKNKFVDCFMLMGTALSFRGDQKPEMGRPFVQDVFTTAVNVSITITQIHFRNLQDMEAQFTFLLHQRWTDPRLGANQRTTKLAAQGQIWRPRVTTVEGENRLENEITQYWRGNEPAGDILLSERIQLSTLCTNDLYKFPFDVQSCHIKLGTYRYPVEEVELNWDTIPVYNSTTNSLREFRITDTVTFADIENRPSGNFSVLYAEISLQRHSEHYILCVYYPCLLSVLITNFNFWISLKSIKIRYFLSGTNFALLFCYYHYSVCSIPVPYLKASDVFVIVCKVFVSVALLENVVIDLIIRKRKFSCHGERIFCKQTEVEHVSRGVLLMDRVLSAAYPVLFAVVALFYCMYYVV